MTLGIDLRCPICGKPKKQKRNKTCSPSCAAVKKWIDYSQETKDKIFAAAKVGIRSNKSKRAQVHSMELAKQLGLDWNFKLHRFYMEARNKGYRNGYSRMFERWKDEKEKIK